jgi:hypothetical protein
VKWKHGIAFTDQVGKHSKKKIVEPSPHRSEKPAKGEDGMQSPIRVIPESRHLKLDPMSRINYSKVYTVEHNVKVCYFGDVDEKYHDRLLTQWTTVLFWDRKAQPNIESQTPVTQATNQVQPIDQQALYPAATTHGTVGLATSNMTGYNQQSTLTAPGYTQGQYTVSYQIPTSYQGNEDNNIDQFSSEQR